MVKLNLINIGRYHNVKFYSEAATNKSLLKNIGITHVLNAAKGEKFSQINTSQEFYKDCGIKFFGVNLMDVDSCRIEIHFDAATKFMHEALSSRHSKLIKIIKIRNFTFIFIFSIVKTSFLYTAIKVFQDQPALFLHI